MQRQLSAVVIICVLIFWGCSKSASHPADEPMPAPDVSQQPPVAKAPDPEIKPPQMQTIPAKANDAAEEAKVPCLKVSGPFCEVMASENECDPRLIENHYKVGDTL